MQPGTKQRKGAREPLLNQIGFEPVAPWDLKPQDLLLGNVSNPPKKVTAALVPRYAPSSFEVTVCDLK
jgi:hypothetical protein